VADASEATALDFSAVPQTQSARLSELLGPLVTISNPLDYQTFIWGDASLMADVFTTAASGFDVSLFVIDQPHSTRCDVSSFEPAFVAMMTAQKRTKRPIFAVATLPDTLDEALSDRLLEGGVTPLLGIDDALAALEAARTPAGLEDWVPWRAVHSHGGTVLDEVAGKALLSAAGIAVPRGVYAAEPAVLEPGDLRPPFALKGLGFAHKSDAGAVRLNVLTPESEPSIPGASGYLLEEMVTGAVGEVLIGAARDPVYGATLTLGFGGVQAELLQDTVTLVAPVTRREIEEALKRLQLWPLLEGYRGGPKADVTAIVDVALKVQRMMAEDASLFDIEINPLLVRETGAIAADALIRRDEI